jgi:hypothetical protein
MELLPTPTRSLVTTDIVEMPYATKLLAEELQTYMNMGMRILTGDAISGLKEPEYSMPGVNAVKNVLAKPLPEIVLPETRVPPYREGVVEVLPSEEQLGALGVLPSAAEQEAAAAEAEAEEAAEAETYVPLTPMEMAAQRNADFAAGTAAAAAAVPVIVQQQQQQQQQQSPSFLLQQPIMQQAQPLVQLQPPPFAAPPSEQEAFNRGVAAARQQMGQQGGMQGGAQYITPAPLVYASPVGGAQVITVDTGPRAMYEGGYQEDLQDAMRGHPVMGSGGGGSSSRRHTTPRNRADSPRRGPMTVAGGNITPATRIVVNRIG